MTIDQKLRLSYYKQVADINSEHSIFLVQDVRDGKFYVKKLLTVYNKDIYHYLEANPIPNTPRILLIEESENILTLIEEYIPGDTLEEILANRGVFSECEAIDMIFQLCEIISAFHSCIPPIVNRDIKPSNIKITPDGIVKLLDLNAAKWSNSQAERDTVLLGTQGFAAPEQYGFGTSGPKTDIYSIGVLLNMMLTGELPGRKLASGALSSVIQKCVELSPDERYENIEQLRTAIQKAVGEHDTNATVTPARPAWKRFLPPGFRGQNVLVWLASAIGYAIALWLCICLEVENAGPTELLLNRIVFGIILFGIIFFSGNYLGVHSKFPLTRSKNIFLKLCGIILIDTLIFVVGLLLLDILVTLLVKPL